ncbi:MAG: PTS sugar transporter subunit IIB [Erysipelotrichaceae bacterium]|nr:PTS sugar transporter subunit IIB [Erysipelotrichaceae bacterium]
MLKVIAACGNGMGSSQMIKMKITKVFKKLGVDVQVDHTSVGAATSMASSYDAVFVSQAFVKNFESAEKKGTKIVGLKNLLSEAEIEEKIVAAGLDKK